MLSLQRQFEILRDQRRHPDGRLYTLQDISNGTDVSVSTLSLIQLGKMKNPQFATLRALCVFFHVPLRYFESQTELDALEVLHAAANAGPPPMLREITLRAGQLSPETQRDLLNILTMLEDADAQRRTHPRASEFPPEE